MSKLDNYIAKHQAEFNDDVNAMMVKENVPRERAVLWVRDEWLEGLADGENSLRTTDWDYGRE